MNTNVIDGAGEKTNQQQGQQAQGSAPAGQASSPAASGNPPAQAAPVDAAKLQADFDAYKSKAEQEKKERDAQIANLSTTLSTIQTRQKPAGDEGARAESGLDGSIKKFAEVASYAPEEAPQHFIPVLKQIVDVVESRQKANDALRSAKTSVKERHAGISDAIVETIFDTAERFALTRRSEGKPYASLDEAVKDAETFVIGEIEGYAKKKYSAPEIPNGAKAEGGTKTAAATASAAPAAGDGNDLDERKNVLRKRIL